jgi:hypothetical protein
MLLKSLDKGYLSVNIGVQFTEIINGNSKKSR